LSGGFVVVDIFFVISGHLITSIIRSELEAGKFSFKNFYGLGGVSFVYNNESLINKELQNCLLLLFGI